MRLKVIKDEPLTFWEQPKYNPLSEKEIYLRIHLEDQIKEGLRQAMQGFYLVGSALKQLKAQKLHRDLHQRFDEYARERFGLGKRYQHYLINAVEVIDALQEDEQYKQKIKGLLPSREFHCRELLKLGDKPSEWKKAWLQSLKAAGEQIPTARTVREIVHQLKTQAEAENPFQIGDICLISAGDNIQLKGLHGCWAIVVATTNYLYNIQTSLGLVKKISSQYLLHSSYTQEQVEQIFKICTLLEQIPNNLKQEEAVIALLKVLGKRYRLSNVEADLLLTLLKQK